MKKKNMLRKTSKKVGKASLFLCAFFAAAGGIGYIDNTTAMAQQINYMEEIEAVENDMENTTLIEEKYQGDNLMYTYYGFANMNGIWYNFIEGSVNNEYTGMGTAETGWSYFINGVQSFDYTGMANNEYGWWYYINGNIVWDYTGMAQNKYGWWYYNNGNIVWDYTGIANGANERWYYKNGNIDLSFCGEVNVDGVNYYVLNGRICEPNEYYTISCWGDSMTAGVGATEGTINTDRGQQYLDHADYPSDLAALTGYKVNNYGFPGARSEEITGGAYQYYTDHETKDILILEIGSNGGWDNNYGLLIDQYQAIIDKSGTTEYIILGDTDDPELSADANQSAYIDDDEQIYVGHNETKWEAALSAAFGKHFFNTRLYLLDNGLSDVGLVPTQEDIDMIERGNLPSALRYDWTHFNNNGYYSKALGIYKKGKELGYW